MVVEEAQERLVSALDEALHKFYDSLWLDPLIVKSDLEKRGIFFRSWDALFSVSLPLLDAQAKSYLDHEKALNALRGVGLGTGGAILMLPDLEELVRSAILLIQKISLTYGFDPSSETGRKEIWRVFALTLTGEDLLGEDPLTVSARLFEKSREKISENMGLTPLLRFIAKKIVWRFVKRRVIQVVPLFGSAVAGFANYRFIEEIGTKAQSYYRSKHLACREAAAREAEARRPEGKG
ncbi:MAG: hypothetical protein D6812_07665 [Deltaproteobacteria bacterium]|nr:MAG: hypothetical protein D6812_07665 [Deltaproteobacteria bacterium]